MIPRHSNAFRTHSNIHFDIRQLVEALSDQCTKAKIDFEIICIDDCSQPAFKLENVEVSDLFGTKYIELERNIGRAKIRELLAQKAKFRHLLFLDCDVEIVSSDFIKNYVQLLDKQVVVGGICYDEAPPEDQSLFLAMEVRNGTRAAYSKTAPTRSIHPFFSE